MHAPCTLPTCRMPRGHASCAVCGPCSLHFLYGKSFEKALEVYATCEVVAYVAERSGRRAFQVRPGQASPPSQHLAGEGERKGRACMPLHGPACAECVPCLPRVAHRATHTRPRHAGRGWACASACAAGQRCMRRP